MEVEVRAAAGDKGRKLERSSAAVLVVDARRAQAEAADLGAVLGRERGINVQRAGGLGSQARISIQGLGEDQVRFYFDGVPLAYTGLPESVAYVPAELIARAEVYRGVVPIRFGGDTLGGAIQLVSPDPVAGLHAAAALTLGAFDTQRAFLRAQAHDEATGLYASGQVFVDQAANDYGMRDVPVAQRDGRIAPRRVHRLHDAYRGAFGQLEVGLLQRPYAGRLVLRGFASRYDKEINHDVLMNNPYGEVEAWRRAQGLTLLYDHEPMRRLLVETRLGYAHRTRRLRDLGKCAYDWYRNCVVPLPNGGEIWGLPADRRTDEHDLFARLQVGFRHSDLLQLRGSIAPTYVLSDAGDQRASAGQADAFAQARRLFGLTVGLEHELDVLHGRLENVLFAKAYVQWLAADITTTAGRATIDRQHHRLGVGDALRVRLYPGLLAKLSYELGVRLPDASEVFGDGVFVEPNVALTPETSHNLNAELRWSYDAARGDSVMLATTAFYRRVSDLIFLLPGLTLAQYHNLADAEVRGLEGAASYVSPHEYVAVEGNVTLQDMRNRAQSGAFAMFSGERIPNRPYLFANLSLTGTLRELAAEEDALALTLRESFVGEFYRAFEVPAALERDAVPAQFVTTMLLTYQLERGSRRVSASFELHNLTNAVVYDFFGVQRPGRHALAKLTLRI